MTTAITRMYKGRAYIEVTFTYREREYTADVYNDQKLLEPWGLVFLGAEFREIMPAKEIPADPENGRQNPLIALGFTDDPEIVAATRKLRELANNEFEVGLDLADV